MARRGSKHQEITQPISNVLKWYFCCKVGILCYKEKGVLFHSERPYASTYRMRHTLSDESLAVCPIRHQMEARNVVVTIRL